MTGLAVHEGACGEACGASPSKPRIGLDVRNLDLPHGTGVASYARATLECCRRLGFETILVSDDPGGRAARVPFRHGRNLALATLPRRRLRRSEAAQSLIATDLFRAAQIHFDLYRRPWRLTADAPPALMHWTYPLPLRLVGVPNIVTIHDLIPLTRPGLSGIASSRLRRMLLTLVRQAACVATVSETVRREIIALLGADPAKVVNLYQAVDLPPDLLARAQAAPPLCPAGCFVVCGTIETRKNLVRLIEAHDASGVATPLALIGPDGDAAGAVDAAIRRHRGGPGAVIRLPFSPRASLVRAMHEARAVLFPSLAEGFGAPIAEAMTLGTPVMTSLGGATAEVAGGAALLIDPEDTGAMADAIRSLDVDAALRGRLAQAGPRRAALFSLDRHAERLGIFYHDVLRSGLYRC